MITTYQMIISAVNTLLASEYPSVKRYGNATVDKAVPPYFFVECIPAAIQRETKMTMHKGCTIKITYIQRVKNDVDALAKIEGICGLLGMVFTVNGRKLLVLDYDHEYIGENNDIPQISFRLDWYEKTTPADTEPKMADVAVQTTLED